MPMVMDWSSRLITDRLTEPTVMGTPMASNWRRISQLCPGSSRPLSRDKWVAVHTVRASRDRITPAVTPAMAPAAAIWEGYPCRSSHQARPRPTTSLLPDSMTSLAAVGRISPMPWV